MTARRWTVVRRTPRRLVALSCHRHWLAAWRWCVALRRAAPTGRFEIRRVS